MAAFVFPENPTEGLEVELSGGRAIVFSNGRWRIKSSTTAITLPHVPEYTSPAREVGGTYANDGNTTRFVTIGFTGSDKVDFTATVDEIDVATCKIADADGNVTSSLSINFMVPPGANYTVTAGPLNTGSVTFWNEFQ